MIAWLAPGQGAERPGMGRDVASAWPAAAQLLSGVDPGLHDTARVQAALTAVALGAAAALAEEGVPCDAVAGHSVGELAAWAVAGGVTAAEAVALAHARGVAMGDAAGRRPGGMWVVDAVPDPLPTGCVVAVENPGQWVVSGPPPGPPGARPVPTSGPWHGPAMAEAAAPFRAALDRLPSRALGHPIASNHDGRFVMDDAVFRAHLVAQLTHPVRWTAVLDTLVAAGCTDVVLLGPGKVLAAQLLAHGSAVRVHRTDRAADVRVTASSLRPRAEGPRAVARSPWRSPRG